MDVLILFGSKSDAYIYDPLKAQLIASDHKVDFRMLSVHRSPELLDSELGELNEQIVVAGAGLAAHLPGVLASKVLQPVLGIPCTPALGGLDALLAMLQMPFGIPVLCSGPDKWQASVNFINAYSGVNLRFSDSPLYVVIERTKKNLPYVQHLLKRLEQIALKADAEWTLVHEPQPGALNLCLVEIDPRSPSAPLPFPLRDNETEYLSIHVPIVEEKFYRDPSTSLALLSRTCQGGLWVGLNNIGNGFLGCLQLSNQSGRFSAVLTNAKKGYIHG